MKIVTAPFGGLVGAVLGGILWAKYIQWTGSTFGFIAVCIGAFTGIGMLLTCVNAIDADEKMHWLLVSIGAAIFAVIGFFVGKYLDVHWNAITQLTEQYMQEQNLTEEQAKPIAETIFSGSSKFELMKNRMEWFDLIFGTTAVIVAFYITFNPRIRKIINKLVGNR